MGFLFMVSLVKWFLSSGNSKGNWGSCFLFFIKMVWSTSGVQQSKSCINYLEPALKCSHSFWRKNKMSTRRNPNFSTPWTAGQYDFAHIRRDFYWWYFLNVGRYYKNDTINWISCLLWPICINFPLPALSCFASQDIIYIK